jgi:hypothetical protein
VLREVSQARGKAEITERINELFGNPEVAQEQAQTSRDFLRAAEPSEEGSEW